MKTSIDLWWSLSQLSPPYWHLTVNLSEVIILMTVWSSPAAFSRQCNFNNNSNGRWCGDTIGRPVIKKSWDQFPTRYLDLTCPREHIGPYSDAILVCWERAATSASSQVSPIPRRSFLTIPLQFVLGRPGPRVPPCSNLKQVANICVPLSPQYNMIQ